MTKISRETAIERTRQLFAHTSDYRTSVRDIFMAFERDMNDEVGNKAWLSNKISPLVAMNLIRTITEKGGYHKLIGLELTLESQVLLGKGQDQPPLHISMPNAAIEKVATTNPTLFERFESPSPKTLINVNTHKTSTEDVLRVVANFEIDNPNLEVEVNFRLRGSSGVLRKG